MDLIIFTVDIELCMKTHAAVAPLFCPVMMKTFLGKILRMLSGRPRLLCVRRYAVGLLLLPLTLLLYAWYCHTCTVTTRDDPGRLLAAALRRAASPDGRVLLSFVDCGYTDLAVNFYETSLRRHAVRHFVFVSPSARCCDALGQLPCVVYRDDDAADVATGDDNATDATTGSRFGAPAFKRKMNRRSAMILTALDAGLTVLHSDTDVVFFADPFPALAAACPRGADLCALLEGAAAYNAGFIYVRPTPASRALYTRMCTAARLRPHISDQRHLNEAIAALHGGCTAVALPPEQFQFGGRYFEGDGGGAGGGRTFAGDGPACARCVVVHNNWMVTKAAKIYRFKEHLMWTGDANGYYSNPRAKYLQYDNPPRDATTTGGAVDAATTAVERDALRSALAIAAVLNRTVILPAFHCAAAARCALNSLYRVTAFDAAFRYREHVFLRHPLVPASVKRSLSPVHLVATTGNAASRRADVVRLVPLDAARGPTSDEILRWLGSRTESVLRFDSLYAAFHRFSDPRQDAAFERNLAAGLETASYRQE